MGNEPSENGSSNPRRAAAYPDRLHHFMLQGDTIRCVTVRGTRMIRQMRRRHGLGILETLVLGHAYLAAALVSADLKGSDRIGIDVGCSGPIKGLTVEANASGHVRGFLKQVPIPIDKPLETFDLAPFFGAGFLTVTKYLQDAKHPFSGKVMMAYGSLAKDLSLYYLKSEQLPTAFSLSILFDRQGRVGGAGGLFVQALPGAGENVLEQLERLVLGLPSMGEVVHQPDYPDQWLHRTFRQMQPRMLGRKAVGFKCRCSRSGISAMLAMLEPGELDDIVRHGPFPVRVQCHYCNTTYAFEQAAVRAIRDKR